MNNLMVWLACCLVTQRRHINITSKKFSLRWAGKSFGAVNKKISDAGRLISRPRKNTPSLIPLAENIDFGLVMEISHEIEYSEFNWYTNEGMATMHSGHGN
jgi:hypothetical protein